MAEEPVIEDRGVVVPTVRDQWIKLIHADGSGQDIFIRPTAILAVTIDAEDHSAATMYIGPEPDEISAAGIESGHKSTAFHFESPEAEEVIDWLERNCGMAVRATWNKPE